MPLSIVIVSNEPPPEGLQLSEPHEFTIHWYVCLFADEPDDFQDVLDLCRRKRAVGILAGAAPVLPLVAWVSEALGLVRVSVQLAQTMNDRGLLLERLRASGVPTIPFRVAVTVDEAVRGAQALGEPVVVQAVEGTEGARSRFVQYMPEVGLGYRQVTRDTGSKRVLITHPASARRHSVWIYVHKGQVAMALMADVEVDPRFMFPTSIAVPGRYDRLSLEEISDLGERVAQAIRFTTGVLRIDLIESPDGPQVVAADMCPISSWLPFDLGRLTGITDLYAAALRLAAGLEPPGVTPGQRGGAVAWLRGSSGEVVSVDGATDAEALEGIQAVCVRIEPTEIIRHIVDQAGRDRLGFVVAAGPDAAAARERAIQGVDAVTIRTQTAYSEDTGGKVG